MKTSIALLAALLAAGCSQPAPEGNVAADAGAPQAPAAPVAPRPDAPDDAAAGAPSAFPAGKWDMVSSGEGDGLFFGVVEGEAATAHLFCPADGGLLVNVNAFRPVGSEERMTIGSGGTAVTLVADPAGDANRGGVSGTGPVPAELAAILTAPRGVSVNYGSQDVGPLPPVPADTARNFVTGCTD
ncbi:hypothetical protein H8M03_07045 [Sphingomonas sabuli]|uniref:Lipoprotein n=1 Tax=Sphingomonas sabuli TaxID=2764186 RepID=A0A7G9KZM1_9SPHN|nr:hypothetical protein [Sphingomonas sabuli]QNM81820.1 hypothetical protein H8M03_07045 [Sphingomonas sabuli]